MGKKKTDKIFSRNTRISRAKNDEKKLSGKSAKTRFLKHMKIVIKNGGKKTRENFFFRNTCISREKNDGKKSSGKSAKTRFFL